MKQSRILMNGWCVWTHVWGCCIIHLNCDRSLSIILYLPLGTKYTLLSVYKRSTHPVQMTGTGFGMISMALFIFIWMTTYQLVCVLVYWQNWNWLRCNEWHLISRWQLQYYEPETLARHTLARNFPNTFLIHVFTYTMTLLTTSLRTLASAQVQFRNLAC